MQNYNWTITFAVLKMVIVAQLVRASVCGTEGRGFEPHHSPFQNLFRNGEVFLFLKHFILDSKGRLLVEFHIQKVRTNGIN